jgi:hypothetical protein
MQSSYSRSLVSSFSLERKPQEHLLSQAICVTHKHLHPTVSAGQGFLRHCTWAARLQRQHARLVRCFEITRSAASEANRDHSSIARFLVWPKKWPYSPLILPAHSKRSSNKPMKGKSFIRGREVIHLSSPRQGS